MIVMMVVNTRCGVFADGDADGSDAGGDADGSDDDGCSVYL